jgi:hypothetical protein
VDVSIETRTLTRSWRVRLRARATVETELLLEIQDCLAALESLGWPAFNVFPSHYEPEPPSPAGEVVNRLRLLGATTGLSTESGPHGFRLHIEPGPALV